MTFYDGYGNPVELGGASVVSGTSVSSVNTLTGGHGHEDTYAKTAGLTPKWSGIFCIHRGWYTAPQNTLQAIWETKKNGINMVELDIRRTSDGQYVLCHDPTATGTVDGVSTTYTIADETLETLKGLCIGNSNFPNAMMASLEEALAFCRRIGMQIDLDLKTQDNQAYLDVLELAKKYSMQDDVLFCCYALSYAQAVKEAYPKASVRVDLGHIINNTALDSYCANEQGNVYFYVNAQICGKTDGSNLTGNVNFENDILPAKQRGYKMYIWNVSSRDLGSIHDCIQWEPDILQLASYQESNNFLSMIQGNTQEKFADVVW